VTYLDRLLAPGESVTVRTRRHAIVLLRNIGAALFLVLAGLFLAVYVGGIGRFSEPARLWAWGGVGLAALGLLVALPAWLRWRNEEYLVTDRRVIQLEGVLAKRALDSTLDKVNDVRLSQSLAGRLFGFGTIEILTASEGGINRLDQVPDPLAFKHAMMAAKGGAGAAAIANAAAPATTATSVAPAATANRLAELEELKRRGLISEAEYRAKREAILDSL
jgi:uncharacterized membrane protein YdbT with pleckstrin-like domain